MAIYISLCNWTDHGVANVKDSPKRLDQARKAWRAGGAKLKDVYLTMGEYDFVIVSEAPDDETAARLALTVSSAGSVRTKTLKAFSEKDYRAIIGSLP